MPKSRSSSSIDFSVHTGPESHAAAGAVSAHAYTTQNAIHFAAGQYAPGTSAGDRLLALYAPSAGSQYLGVPR